MFNTETTKLATEVQRKLLGIQFFSNRANIRKVVAAIAEIENKKILLDALKKGKLPFFEKKVLSPKIKNDIACLETAIFKANIKTDQDATAYLKIVANFCDEYQARYIELQKEFDQKVKKLNEKFSDRRVG